MELSAYDGHATRQSNQKIKATDNALNVSVRSSVKSDTDTDGINKSVGGTVNDGVTFLIDNTGYRSVRIWGSTTGALEVHATNAVNIANQNFWGPIEDIAIGTFNIYIQDPPKNIRIRNNTGGQLASVHLHYHRHL